MLVWQPHTKPWDTEKQKKPNAFIANFLVVAPVPPFAISTVPDIFASVTDVK